MDLFLTGFSPSPRGICDGHDRPLHLNQAF